MLPRLHFRPSHVFLAPFEFMWPFKWVDVSPTQLRVCVWFIHPAWMWFWPTRNLNQRRDSRVLGSELLQPQWLDRKEERWRTGRHVILGGIRATRTTLNVMNLIMLTKATAWPQAPIIQIHAVVADDVQPRLDDIVVSLADFFKVMYYKSSPVSTVELLRNGWWGLLYLSAGAAPHAKQHTLMRFLS